MTNDSFEFGGVDMAQRFGIYVIAYDVLMPTLRPRKVVVPGRSGAYDFGAKYRDERPLRMECDTRINLTRHEMRELAYLLSKKNVIRLWDDPDVHYIGRIYDTTELINISIGFEFNLTFTCDPCVYGSVKTLNISGSNPQRIALEGTEETPTRISITNNGDVDAVGIQIRLRTRKETY